jgi:hypothetical protein
LLCVMESLSLHGLGNGPLHNLGLLTYLLVGSSIQHTGHMWRSYSA